MTIREIKPQVHDLPVWVNYIDECVRYETGADLPDVNDDVVYITVNGVGELVLEVFELQGGIYENGNSRSLHF